MATLTPGDVHLLRGLNFGHVATIATDGSPHVSPMWLDERDGFVLLNTAAGRVKDRNVARDPRVAISVHDQADPYTWLAVRGTVVERTTEGAAEHIDELNRRYHDGEAWEPRPGEQRVIYRIRPDRIARSGG